MSMPSVTISGINGAANEINFYSSEYNITSSYCVSETIPFSSVGITSPGQYYLYAQVCTSISEFTMHAYAFLFLFFLNH